jgi:hypothetical protein
VEVVLQRRASSTADQCLELMAENKVVEDQ